jgi:hypothetical protein
MSTLRSFDPALINYLVKLALRDAGGNREHAKRLTEQLLTEQLMPQVIARIDETFKCDHCKKCFWHEVRLGPVLKDEVWLQLAAQHETLCGACVIERAAARGVTITFADLRPCGFNLKGGAQSWFEVFGGENVSECEEWNEARRMNDERGPIELEKYELLFEPKGG